MAPILLEEGAIASQRCFLCSAGHDIHTKGFDLVAGPIVLGRGAWVAAEAFVGPGVRMGDGAVAAARACVVKSVAAWTVVAGNPAKKVGKRRKR